MRGQPASPLAKRTTEVIHRRVWRRPCEIDVQYFDFQRVLRLQVAITEALEMGLDFKEGPRGITGKVIGIGEEAGIDKGDCDRCIRRHGEQVDRRQDSHKHWLPPHRDLLNLRRQEPSVTISQGMWIYS